MRIPWRFLAVAALAAGPASAGGPQRDTAPAAVYEGAVSRALGLEGARRDGLRAIFDEARPELEALEARRMAAERELIAARVGRYHRWKEAERRKDRAKIAADLKGEVAPEQQRLWDRLTSASSAEDALWERLWERIRALAGGPSLASAKSRIADVRYARAVRDHMVALSDASDFLGRARQMKQVENAQAALAGPWAAAWKDMDLPRFKALLAPGFTSSPWSAFAPARENRLYREESLKESQSLSGDAALASIEAFLSRYRRIEHVDIDLFGADDDGGRTVLPGTISVAGEDAETGTRAQTTAVVLVGVEGDGASQRIASLKVSRGRRVVSRLDHPFFRDATASSGLGRLPVYLREEAIRRGGYALASHTEPDGTQYLYVGSSKEGRLLKGGGNGRFSDVTDGSGLGKDELVKAAVFADFDNDGKTDLLLVRFDYSSRKQIVLYQGLGGGRFRPAQGFDFSRFGKYALELPMPVAVGDFDGDQRLDFYVGFPGKLDFTTLASRSAYRPGHPQGLFLNRGGFAFSDETDYALYHDPSYPERMGTPSLFPHSAVAADLDGDGRTDLVVVDDRQDPMPIFHNEGGGLFRQVAEKVGVRNSNWGMTAAVADASNSGHPDLYLTDVNFPLSFAMTGTTDWLFARSTADPNPAGNRFYRNDGHGHFKDVTDEAGLRFTGTAPAGATFVDFDNDGLLDLYVVNGLWTAGPESFDRVFLSASLVESILTSDEFGEIFPEPRTEAWRSLWGSRPETNAVLALLKNYVTADGTPLYSLGGGQRNRLYRNNGDGTFTDVSYLSGLDSLSDGYVAVVADVDRDGSPDLILRNCDPGTTAKTFPTVELFVNSVGALNHRLDLRLSGVQSNRDAIGAHVTLLQRGGLRQSREVIANDGAAQDENLVHFGLGAAASVAKLVVRWPTGRTQAFEGVAAGTYALTEGGALRNDEPAFVTGR